MTFTDVWVGELGSGDDPLDWGGDWKTGNSAGRAVTPMFPPAATGTYEPHHTVCSKIKAGLLTGKQVDWGAWAAIVTKAEISGLIDEVYGTDAQYCQLEHLCIELAHLRSAVAELSDSKSYALIADEF